MCHTKLDSDAPPPEWDSTCAEPVPQQALSMTRRSRGWTCWVESEDNQRGPTDLHGEQVYSKQVSKYIGT